MYIISTSRGDVLNTFSNLKQNNFLLSKKKKFSMVLERWRGKKVLQAPLFQSLLVSLGSSFLTAALLQFQLAAPTLKLEQKLKLEQSLELEPLFTFSPPLLIIHRPLTPIYLVLEFGAPEQDIFLESHS